MLERYQALPPRQKDVLTLLCHGFDNRTIAFHLGLKETGVKSHVRKLFNTLGADSRLQLVVLVRRLKQEWL